MPDDRCYPSCTDPMKTNRENCALCNNTKLYIGVEIEPTPNVTKTTMVTRPKKIGTYDIALAISALMRELETAYRQDSTAADVDILLRLRQAFEDCFEIRVDGERD